MASVEPQNDEPPASHRHEHEASDVNVRLIALSGALALVFGVLIHFLLGALMNYFSEQQSSTIGATRPLSDILWQASEPRLQVDPAAELTKKRTKEDVVLNSYGWVDRKRGIVRIPIDNAIELRLKQGMPARSSISQEKDKARNE
ncbi:MAG TPA: hypothetical protein VGZ22_03255 [Isosphaeraceae bacterium]|jgi:hypothetical protein|nr:hypothetical protein [Isosphaeraceae bacterium]